jgi:hypothetical protein
MPVSFGTVEVIPQSPPAAAPAHATAAAAGSSGAPVIDPRELAPALRQVADREARVRAH